MNNSLILIKHAYNYMHGLFRVIFIMIIPLLSSEISFSQTSVIDSLEQVLISSSIDQKINILNQLSIEHLYNNHEKAISYAEQALTHAKEYENKPWQAESLKNLSRAYSQNDNYSKALELCQNSLMLYEKLNDIKNQAIILKNMGWIYYDTENAYDAVNYFEKSLELNLKLLDTAEISLNYNGIGLAYSILNDNDKAISYYKSSLKLAENIKLKRLISATNNNLGMAYTALGSYELALDYLDKALETRPDTTLITINAEIYNQKAHAFIGLNQLDKAAKWLDKSKNSLEKLKSRNVLEKLKDNLEIRSKLYAKKKNYKAAYTTLKDHLNIKEEILSKSKSNKLLSSSVLIEGKKKEDEIFKLESQKKGTRTLLIYSLIIFVLIVIIIGLTHSKLRSAHKLVKEKEMMLQEKLDFKTNEMTNYALHIAQRNDLLNKFLVEITKIERNAEGVLAKELQILKLEINQSQIMNKDLEDFYLDVERTYKDFFYNLTSKYSDLTNNDKRLAAKLRLNLSNKDIALINNVSIKSVEMARYRLRKRLKLDQSEKFEDFLSRF